MAAILVSGRAFRAHKSHQAGNSVFLRSSRVGFITAVSRFGCLACGLTRHPAARTACEVAWPLHPRERQAQANAGMPSANSAAIWGLL